MVAGTVFVGHHRVLSAQAVSFDDEETILHNPLVQDPSWHSVKQFFGEVRLSSVVPGYYRPLTLTSLMLDWAMGGRPDNFRPFHRTSLALHIGSTLLLILLCWQLFDRPVAAAAAGLLFGLHPLTVEPIAWVMERKTILAAFFAFACLNAYLRYTRHTRPLWLAAAVVLYLLSLLAKPTGTPLPLIMLLMDYWPLKRFSKRALLEKVPFFALAAAFAVLAVVCENEVNPLHLPAKDSPLHLPLRLCWLIVFYLGKVVLPIHLSSAYPLPNPLSLRNAAVAAAVVGTVVLIAALAASRRWTPAWWAAAAIFYVGLAPTMGFVGYSWVVASDKYVYFPAVGLVILVAWGLDRLWLAALRLPGRGAARAVLAAGVLAAATAEGLATHRQLYWWRDTVNLCQRMLAATPDAWSLEVNLGAALTQAGQYGEALPHLRRALELKPRSWIAYNNLGTILANQGRINEAIACYQRALRLKPGYVDAMNNLAWDLSVHEFRKPPANADAVALAEAVCRRTGYRRPGFLDTLAAAYANVGRFDEAVRTAERALNLANAAGQKPLARQIQQRLDLYRAQRPLRE